MSGYVDYCDGVCARVCIRVSVYGTGFTGALNRKHDFVNYIHTCEDFTYVIIVNESVVLWLFLVLL